ncbi:MAG: 16S rRNA (adenine(1518)-N(6)/adenine(1519)-N(6))-dimethyltransferase RsmA [Flavobacteriaceae bacterium]|nr:16S rRNA (adenine(1518)-N(6)/adenine(1519)-N(6))-dimethyltransferase RsmA [Flavobacteriaceae bacterium]NNL78919.1 16S rRNA (adenine(1518)-N(6)/adenine(1519)-N(6))-dimethyltransferase RsmA [Flavobacteriaceae bacterium]
MSVRAKKYLGQHFLIDENIAKKIADSLSLNGYNIVLEIGPGMGMLTKYLLKQSAMVYVNEIDSESVTYLEEHFPELQERILERDFLKLDINGTFNQEPLAIIGNFPYNISSQIVFKTLENREQIPEFCGMFQKEVAERICEGPGSKKYGILSILVQAFYDVEYLFTVSASVFNPPPKVTSGVIRLRRKDDFKLDCDEALFFRVVKTAFNQRRKTLRNSLKSFGLSDKLKANVIFGQRPEQLEVQQFIELTQLIQNDKKSD